MNYYLLFYNIVFIQCRDKEKFVSCLIYLSQVNILIKYFKYKIKKFLEFVWSGIIQISYLELLNKMIKFYYYILFVKCVREEELIEKII